MEIIHASANCTPVRLRKIYTGLVSKYKKYRSLEFITDEADWKFVHFFNNGQCKVRSGIGDAIYNLNKHLIAKLLHFGIPIC